MSQVTDGWDGWVMRVSEARQLVETGAVREQTWWRQTAADYRDGYAIVTTALSVLGWPALLRLDELKATAAAFGDYEIMQQGKGRTLQQMLGLCGYERLGNRGRADSYWRRDGKRVTVYHRVAGGER